jgi:hypothetical protein
MKTISILVIALCASCSTNQNYVKVPLGTKQYLIQRRVIGFKCPLNTYHDITQGLCLKDAYSGYLELDSTTLTISGDSKVIKYNDNEINIVRK